MMLIGLTIATLLITSAASFAEGRDVARRRGRPDAEPLPTLTIDVDAAGVSSNVVARTFAEADLVWRPLGVSIAWRGAADAADPRGRALRVVIGDEPGHTADGRPLGWITFSDRDEPEPLIHLSRANAFALLSEMTDASAAIVARQEILLGRGLGRALAHEVGHFLLSSRLHTRRGLMQSPRTASGFFGEERSGFDLEPGQRAIVAERVRKLQCN